MKPNVPPTREQQAAIEQMLGNVPPTLFLPASFVEPSGTRRVGFPDGSRSLVPPTYADVSAKPSSVRDFFCDLQEADMSVAIYELASLNVLLDRLGTDEEFQRAAVRQYVRPEFRNWTPPATYEPRPNYQFIINRIGSMIALKGVVGVERPIGPTLPSQFKTGDLILRANQFVSGTRFDGEISNQTDADLAAETVCTWDLTNPRDIGYETARINRMLALVDSSDETVGKLRSKLGITRSDLRFADLSVIDFLAIVFGIVALVGNLAPDIVLSNPLSASVNSRNLLANVKIPQAVLDAFLAKRSISIWDLRNKLTEQAPWTMDDYCRKMESSKFRTDFLLFRQFPLVAMSEAEYVIPNLQFLTELLFSGLFFELYFSRPSAQRELLSSLWGRLFELSMFEILAYFYPPLSRLLRTNVEFTGGEIDAMLDFGDYIVVFEFKHFLLTHDVKYSRSGTLLEEALRQKLFSNQVGKPKAIQQLIRSAASIRSGEIQTLKGRANSRSCEAAIYPVIVVADAALEAPFVNVFCNKLFQTAANDMEVMPLTTMSVHEFEDSVPIIGSGQLTWRELFNFRFERKSLKPTSINQARYMLAQEKNLTYVRNEFRLSQFQEILQQILARFTGSEPHSLRK